MDLHKLEYVVTIAEENNITKAAERLHISQPTLSSFLSSLEKDLNIILFTRKKNVLHITESGQKYVDTCKKILSLREELYRDLYSGKSDVLHVGMQFSNLKLLSQAILNMQAAHPGIFITPLINSSSMIYKEILEGRLSFGYVTSYEEDPSGIYPGVQYERISEYELMLVMSANSPLYRELFIENGQLKPSDIEVFRKYPLYISPIPMIQKRILGEILPENHLEPLRIEEQNTNADLIPTILEVSNAFSINPFNFYTGNIVQVMLPTHPKIYKYMIYGKNRMLTPLEREFNRTIRQLMQNNPYYSFA